MKIIKKGKRKEYPQHKKLKCDNCKTKMIVNLSDCYKSESVLGVPTYYVECPICCHSIPYGVIPR